MIGAALLLLGITSCKQVELDTAQYADDVVTLASFGPNPVMRGAQLRFFGSNLDRIESVEVPGIDPIKSIEVVSTGKVSEIRVSLPVEGPEVGYVTIVSKDGERFTTVSELTYKEPIVFDGFQAASPAFPGDVVKLTGDYMNLVKSVEFEGGSKVDVEEGATRHEASVIIPADALTGKIILSDGGSVENLFYSEAELVIGEPTINEQKALSLKAGSTITVTGKHLEMIEKVLVGGVELTDFTLAEDNGSISFLLPDSAADGNVSVVSFAGKEYVVCGIATVAPEVTKVSPAPVKAGKTLTIEGKNLDLVTKVDFDGAEGATFSYAAGNLAVAVPAEAKEGKITLGLANGKTIEAEFTLVHPTITAVAPLELFAGDEDVTVEGTDLDLIVSAMIGTKDAEIKSKSATKLVLKTTVSSVSGNIELTLANGEKLTSEESVVMKYHSKVIVTSINNEQHIGEEVVIKGDHLNLVETIYIGGAKVTDYALRTPDEIKFIMPYNSIGDYDVRFLLYDGDEEVQANKITVLLEREFNTLFEGKATVSWNNAVTIPYSSIAAAKGGTLYVYYNSVDMADGYHMIRIINNDWSFNPDGDSNYNWNFGSEDGYFAKAIDQSLLSNLNGKDLSLTGYGCEITKVVAITEISQEITAFEGPIAVSWGAGGQFGVALEYFENLEPGAKLIFYLTHTADWGQIQINNGWWGNDDIMFPEVGGAYIKTDLIGDATRVELTLTADVLNVIKTKAGDFAGATSHISPSGKYGLVIQGQDFQIDKITVLP